MHRVCGQGHLDVLGPFQTLLSSPYQPDEQCPHAAIRAALVPESVLRSITESVPSKETGCCKL